MTRVHRLSLVVFALALVAAACGDDDESPALSGITTTSEAETTTTAEDAGDEASVAFGEPADGATVARRFAVAFEVEGFELEPAGEVREGAGHLHVIVDEGCAAAGDAIPKDATHIHFGKGQSKGQLFLEPGEHELCLQAGDGTHVALDITDEISVTVDEALPYVTLGVPSGDTLTSPVAVTMEAHGITIEPAGEVREGAGHFHVMIDSDCVTPGQPIPKDAQHVHFGDGSTEAQLELEPGEHKLCLQPGDGAHVALDVTHVVTVVVG